MYVYIYICIYIYYYGNDRVRQSGWASANVANARSTRDAFGLGVSVAEDKINDMLQMISDEAAGEENVDWSHVHSPMPSDRKGKYSFDPLTSPRATPFMAIPLEEITRIEEVNHLHIHT